MNSLCKAIAKGKNVLLETHIDHFVKEGGLWFLVDQTGQRFGPFDWLVTALPAPQAEALIPENIQCFKTVGEVEMQPCYSLMLGFEEKLPVLWDAAVVKDSCIGWMSLGSLRPQRRSGCSLVIHSTNTWANENLALASDAVESHLMDQCIELLACNLPKINYRRLHRWRYASTVINPVHHDFFMDPKACLGVCGDWFIQGHVESAFLSAYALAQSMRDQLC